LAFEVTEAPGVLLSGEIDLYREICCAMGSAASLEYYRTSVRASGSAWSSEDLARFYPALHRIPLQVELVPSCRFLHFGSTRQLIESGQALQGEGAPAHLSVNNYVSPTALVDAPESWVEGCRIRADVHLPGQNVLTGVDVDEPLSLSPGACLEVLRGSKQDGTETWFVRCYGVGDTFKRGSQFCGKPLEDWLKMAGLAQDDGWPCASGPDGRNLWNARLFPAVRSPGDYLRWLWMHTPESATSSEIAAFHEAERYSSADIAAMADLETFHSRRLEIWKMSKML
jgi:hypothetical protein